MDLFEMVRHIVPSDKSPTAGSHSSADESATRRLEFHSGKKRKAQVRFRGKPLLPRTLAMRIYDNRLYGDITIIEKVD